MSAREQLPADLALHRADRRRQNTMTSMETALRSALAGIERARELGNDSGAVAMLTISRELGHAQMQALSLHKEFFELAELDHEIEEGKIVNGNE